MAKYRHWLERADVTVLRADVIVLHADVTLLHTDITLLQLWSTHLHLFAALLCHGVMLHVCTHLKKKKKA